MNPGGQRVAKPRLFSRKLVHPRWGWFWRLMAHPSSALFGMIDGHFVDLLGNHRPTEGGAPGVGVARSGLAVDFNGGDTYDWADAFDPTEMTCAVLWTHRVSASNGRSLGWTRSLSTGPSGFDFTHMLRTDISSDETPTFAVSDADNFGNYVKAVGPAMVDGGEYFLVGTVKDGGAVRLYVDGVEGTPSTGFGAQQTSQDHWWFGASAEFGNYSDADGLCSLALYTPFEMTGEQVRQWSLDPFGPLKPTYAVALEAAGSGVTVAVPVGAATYTGLVPTIDATGDLEVAVPVGSATYTGLVPTIDATANLDVEVPVGSASYAGLVPTVDATANVDVEVPVGSATYAGLVPTVDATANLDVEVPVGAATYTGLVPTVTTGGDLTVSVPVGSATYAGLVPTVDATGHLDVAVPVGGASFAGLAPSLEVEVPVPVGSATYTGLVPTVDIGANLTIEVPAGAASWVGLEPTVVGGEDVVVPVPVGSVVWLGFAPTLSTPQFAELADLVGLRGEIRRAPQVGGSIVARVPLIGGSIVAATEINGTVARTDP